MTYSEYQEFPFVRSHEPARAKKTPPKTSEQMTSMLRSGCLPDWAPMVGLAAEVSTYNSLPPSLFMPLASLTHLAASGQPYRYEGMGMRPRDRLPSNLKPALPRTGSALGQAELTQWDKFKDTRTASGSTQGGILASVTSSGGALGGGLPKARGGGSQGGRQFSGSGGGPSHLFIHFHTHPHLSYSITNSQN